MKSNKKLDSPIPLRSRRWTTTPEMFSFLAPPKKHARQAFVKTGSLYDQLGRFFVGLSPAWSGISAIEFAEGAPVSFVSHCMIEDNSGVERVTPPLHKNVLTLKEAFAANNHMFFLYAQWGLTLKEIQKLSPVFQLREVEVATVCKGVGTISTYIGKFVQRKLTLCRFSED